MNRETLLKFSIRACSDTLKLKIATSLSIFCTFGLPIVKDNFFLINFRSSDFRVKVGYWKTEFYGRNNIEAFNACNNIESDVLCMQ